MLLPTVSHLTSWRLPLNEITRTTSQEIILSQPNQKLSTTWTRNSVHKHSWNCGQRAALGESNSLSVQRPLSYYLHDCGKTHIQFMRLLRFFELMSKKCSILPVSLHTLYIVATPSTSFVREKPILLFILLLSEGTRRYSVLRQKNAWNSTNQPWHCKNEVFCCGVIAVNIGFTGGESNKITHEV